MIFIDGSGHNPPRLTRFQPHSSETSSGRGQCPHPADQHISTGRSNASLICGVSIAYPIPQKSQALRLAAGTRAFSLYLLSRVLKQLQAEESLRRGAKPPQSGFAAAVVALPVLPLTLGADRQSAPPPCPAFPAGTTPQSSHTEKSPHRRRNKRRQSPAPA